MNNRDIIRELEKIGDVFNTANTHFQAEAKMNAALHLSENVRPAPLATAVEAACSNLDGLVRTLTEEAEGGRNAD